MSLWDRGVYQDYGTPTANQNTSPSQRHTSAEFLPDLDLPKCIRDLTTRQKGPISKTTVDVHTRQKVPYRTGMTFKSSGNNIWTETVLKRHCRYTTPTWRLLVLHRFQLPTRDAVEGGPKIVATTVKHLKNSSRLPSGPLEFDDKTQSCLDETFWSF